MNNIYSNRSQIFIIILTRPPNKLFRQYYTTTTDSTLTKIGYTTTNEPTNKILIHTSLINNYLVTNKGLPLMRVDPVSSALRLQSTATTAPSPTPALDTIVDHHCFQSSTSTSTKTLPQKSIPSIDPECPVLPLSFLWIKYVDVQFF